jgi:hypothetical protein
LAHFYFQILPSLPSLFQVPTPKRRGERERERERACELVEMDLLERNIKKGEEVEEARKEEERKEEEKTQESQQDQALSLSLANGSARY